MSEDQLRNAFEAVRARLQSELDDQFAALEHEQRQALGHIRREIEAELEQRWAAKIEEVRAEWAARVESERAAADTEAAGRMLAERQRLTAELDHERQQLHATREELERTRASFARERETAEGMLLERTSAAAAAQLSERQAQLLEVERLLGAARSIAAASSLSDTLLALLHAAAAEAPRVALFVVNRTQLQGWKAAGFEGPLPVLRVEEGDSDVLRDALAGRRVVSTPVAVAPAFASLAPDRAGMALPIMVGGQPVALLYADDGTGEPHAVPAAWPEALQLLALYASEHLAYMTAVRSAQAGRLVPPGDAGRAAGTASAEDETAAARRYARLLVAELKLYNEAAVRQGRDQGDLLERLGPQIDRARRLYEQRVPPAVRARTRYFDQELVETLAGGDPARLGSSGVNT